MRRASPRMRRSITVWFETGTVRPSFKTKVT
jgi:hypothetical protein